MNMNAELRLKELGVVLPQVPAKAGLFMNCKQFGENLFYVSGCGPDINGKLYKKGKLGTEITIIEGQEAAEKCILNALSILQERLGSVNRIRHIVKLLVFVASESDFYLQPQVANGATRLLINIFGEDIGCPARSAIGVYVLPGNIPVEIEMIVEAER